MSDCPITGTAEVQRVEREIVDGDRIVDVRYNLEWVRTDPEIHVATDLSEREQTFLTATYELGERCPHTPHTVHARLREDA